MKRIPRDPLKFDAFSLLAIYGQQEKIALGPQLIESLVGKIRSSISSSITDERFKHGHRVQAMFEAMVASFGQVQLLKQEDAGELYAIDESIEVPDFRIVLNDGKQLLIEVKNFFQKTDEWEEPFQLPQCYLEGLLKYSSLMKLKVVVAVYWAKWNSWTLVQLDAFKLQDGRASLLLGEALMKNEMSILGDRMIGTKFPLRLKMLVSEAEPRTIGKDGSVTCKFRDIEFYCADQKILDDVAKNIAWHFMLYGKWIENAPEAFRTGDQLDSIQFEWMPVEDHKQGFEIVGSLSEMFSSFYNHMTIDAGELKHIRCEVTPGQWGRLIPDGFHDDAL